MCVSVENALRLAILVRPEAFGLVQEEVNPLLMFVCRMDDEDADVEDLSGLCFDECNSNVYHKLTEVLAMDARRKSKPAANRTKRAAKTKAKTRPKPKGNGKASATGQSGPKLSVKQLRYMGYLQRQLGEVPDYSEIGLLSQKQASMRIRELEEQLGVASEA